MNDHDLGAVLDLIHTDLRRRPAPAELRARVQDIPSTTDPRHGLLPQISGRRLLPMFGALRFVVAGVVVALFGGFLLAGVLTTQERGPERGIGASVGLIESAPLDLRTEVVRPGIERVLEDGNGNSMTQVRYVDVAADGTVWVATGGGTVVRLGRPRPYSAVADGYPSPIKDLVVLRDGTPLVRDMRRFATFDGERWVLQEPPHVGPMGPGIGSILQTTDGELWIGLTQPYEGEDYRLARLHESGSIDFTWDDLGIDTEGPDVSALAETPDGTIWVGVSGFETPNRGLIRYDGEAWRAEDPFGDGEPYDASDLFVLPGGDLLARLWSGEESGSHIGRWDGRAWAVTRGDGDFTWGEVDQDGTAWSLGRLRSWDRGSITDYEFPGPFSGVTVVDVASSPDGLLWVVLAGDGGGQHLAGGPAPGLYMVDPSAAAASIPDREDLGEVLIDHPEFAGEIVAHVFRLGDRWFADVDSTGPTGDRLTGVDRGAENPVGSGPDARAAIEDALAVLGSELAKEAASYADLGDQ